jgi:hypothetical protein
MSLLNGGNISINYIDWVNEYKTTITEIDNTISILKDKLGRESSGTNRESLLQRINNLTDIRKDFVRVIANMEKRINEN